MKFRVCHLFVPFALLLLLSGCIYSDIKVPLDTDVASTTLGTKIGTASNHSVLWLFAWGDAGTEAAAKNGQLTTIRHLDVQHYVILFGIYSRMTTIAYGD
jgi:hypothetical protein